MKVRIVSVLIVILLLSCLVASPVSAEENWVFQTDEGAVKIEQITDMLKLSDKVSLVYAKDDSVYYVFEGNQLARVSLEKQAPEILYTSDFQINYYVPCGDEGALIGTLPPVDSKGNAYAVMSMAEGLTWPGEYHYLDYSSETLSTVEEPGRVLWIATSTSFENCDYSTTINGKAIPADNYPVGSYCSINIDGATECQGFGYWVLGYLYGHYTNTAETSESNGWTGGDLQTIIQGYPFGTLIRAGWDSNNRHTMIYIGRDSNGIYVYHSNWGETNIVRIAYITYENFEATFPYIFYVKYHTHDYGNSWTSVSSTQHRRTCGDCGYTVTASHRFGAGWTSASSTQHKRSCSDCGYTETANHTFSASWVYHNAAKHKKTCSVCGYMKLANHTYGSDGNCTVCYEFVLPRKMNLMQNVVE